MNVLRWAGDSIREKGLIQTTAIVGNVILDLAFDWRNGTDTMGWVDRDDLDASSDNQIYSAPYRATKARPFKRLLSELALPKDCQFVDLGSGKGRALLIAAEYGFREVVGVEFSSKLASLARRNVDVYTSKHPELSPINVVEADAAEYDFEPAARVIFMYNPFGDHIVERVLTNLRRSLEGHPRQTWLIYNTPLSARVVEGSDLFSSQHDRTIGGNHFRVYGT